MRFNFLIITFSQSILITLDGMGCPYRSTIFFSSLNNEYLCQKLQNIQCLIIKRTMCHFDHLKIKMHSDKPNGCKIDVNRRVMSELNTSDGSRRLIETFNL